MKLNNKTLFDSRFALQRLGNERLPVKASYAVSRNLRNLKPELETLDKTRMELFRKYGVEKDGQITVKAENEEAFSKEDSELMGIEIEVDIRMVNLSEVDCAITPADLIALEWMLVVE